jgi:hypothetical protein
VAVNTSQQIVAVDGAGNAEWTSASYPFPTYPQPTVGDLEGDGDVEIVVDMLVVSGTDGSPVATLNSAPTMTMYRTPVIADINDDGFQEIILGENVFDYQGNWMWAAPTWSYGTFNAVADIDGDSGGEVFFVGGPHMYVYEPDGTQITSVGLGTDDAGQPSVADFDGDGVVELAVPTGDQINVVETDGTPIWTYPVQDNSGLCGCSGYDVDGDGAYEVLYADEVTFRMFDGATGTLLYENNSHSSGTVWEYPVVADVDGDGSAEIVIASNGTTWKGITVFGHAGDGWAKSGPTWPTHDFAVTNVEEDGHVPSPAPLSWQVHNVFRARPIVDNPGIADLVPLLEDYCITDCDDGPIKISYGVYNQGGWTAAAGAPISLYGLDGDTWFLIDTQNLPEVAAGASVPGGVFEMVPEDWINGFVLSADDGGQGYGLVEECDEGNNAYVYHEQICGD